MTADSALYQKYCRAVRLTAPKATSGTTGVAVDGYWVDENCYFFLADRVDSSIERIVHVPCIAHRDTHRIEELVSLDVLADVISAYTTQRVDLRALANAHFAMPNRHSLAISVAKRDILLDLQHRNVIKVRDALDVPALYSSDGRYACYVKGQNLALRDWETGTERALTTDGALHHCYGQASETGLSAISYRQNPSPAGLWSPGSAWFLTHRIDERHVPELPLVQNVPPGGGRPVLHRYKYCTPEDSAPVATYVAIHVTSGRTVTFDEFPVVVSTFSPFFLRRAWFEGEDVVWFLRFDRYCKHVELVRFDLKTATGRVVLSETAASGYLDLHAIITVTPNVRTLTKSNELIWFSDRDGWGHLYLHDASSGSLKNRITQGDWLVRDIVHVDEQQRKVFFLAADIDSNADPARRSFCCANLDGTGFEVLLNHDGDIFVPKTQPCGYEQDRPFRAPDAQPGMSPDGRFAVVRYASVNRGNLTEVVELQGSKGFPIAFARPAPDEVMPRHFTALAADGVTRLHGVMFLPSDFDPNARYPLIDHIYPGPQVLQQPQSFRSANSALSRALAELGFVTVMFDTRRMAVGARAQQQIGYGGLLEPQLADHVAVVRQLCRQHSFIDADRVGIIGQSGGGRAAARALCDYSELFKVGVAVCGGHDPSLYTTLTSDKYRGPEGSERWPEQANAAVAYKLRGKLLLISGDMDENVHMSHTLGLVDALIRSNKDFDLLIVPNAGHLVLMDNGYAQRRAWDYFVRHLRGETPPPDFEIKFEPDEMALVLKTMWRECWQ